LRERQIDRRATLQAIRRAFEVAVIDRFADPATVRAAPEMDYRRAFMAIAAQFKLDRRSVGFLQGLRRKYGDGPLALVFATEP
jgi:hypothetical protein